MIKNLIDPDEPEPQPSDNSPSAANPVPALDAWESKGDVQEEPFILSRSEPLSAAETVRRGGLAYSAGIALFASVLFMLVIGWGADLLLGSSPWGIVFGIILGALIGFVQFFRLTSQIFKK